MEKVKTGKKTEKPQHFRGVFVILFKLFSMFFVEWFFLSFLFSFSISFIWLLISVLEIIVLMDYTFLKCFGGRLFRQVILSLIDEVFAKN